MPVTVPKANEIRDEARRLYESSKLSCREIGAKLNVPGNTITTWSQRGGWTRTTDNPRKHLEKVAKSKLIQRIDAKIDYRANEIVNKSAAIVEELQAEASEWMKTVRRVREQIDSTGVVDVEEFAKASGGMKNVVEVVRKVHGIDQDNGPKITAELRLQVVEINCSEPPKQVTIDVETVSPGLPAALPEGADVDSQ